MWPIVLQKSDVTGVLAARRFSYGRGETLVLRQPHEAERAAEPELKKTYLDLARAWRDVADDITNNRLLASPSSEEDGEG
jgi:hypothetical protein